MMKDKSMKYSICTALIVMMMTIGLVIGDYIIASADSGINSAESEIIGVVSGTFTYEGKTYRAKSEYISKVYSYLNRDDIDVSSADAQAAIERIYDSVEEGIDGGYLYEVTSTTEATTEEPGSEEVSEEPTEETEATTEQDPVTTEEVVTATEAEEATEDIWKEVGGETSTERKSEILLRPEEEKADAVITFDEENNSISIVLPNGKTLEIKKGEEVLSENTIYFVTGVFVVIAAIVLVCGILLAVNQCMRFRYKRSSKMKKGHTKRRKIRMVTREIITVSLAIALLGLSVNIVGYTGLFNESVLMRNLSQSGYYQYSYEKYKDEIETKATLGELSEEELADMNSTEQYQYEKYMYKLKGATMVAMETGDISVVPEDNIAPYIYGMKKSFMKIFAVTLPIQIATILVALVLLYYMDQQRGRGLKRMEIALVIAALTLTICTIALLIWQPYKGIYVEPDYIYCFFVDAVRWLIEVLAILSVIALTLNAAVYGAYMLVKNK